MQKLNSDSVRRIRVTPNDHWKIADMGSDVEAAAADIATGIGDVMLGLLMWQLELLSIVGAEVLC